MARQLPRIKRPALVGDEIVGHRLAAEGRADQHVRSDAVVGSDLAAKAAEIILVGVPALEARAQNADIPVMEHKLRSAIARQRHVVELAAAVIQCE